MARVNTILLACLYVVSIANIASNTPVPSVEEKLLEELEELLNLIQNPPDQTSENVAQVENAIYSEITSQDSLPNKEELQVLDEHINIPSTLPPDDGDDSRYDHSIELQLFEVGKDEDGNRIYSTTGIEDELEALAETKVGGSASEMDDDDDDLEDANLEKQLEDLAHRVESFFNLPTEEPASGSSSVESNEGSGNRLDIGESHAGVGSSSEESSNEGSGNRLDIGESHAEIGSSSEESSNEGSGNRLDTGSGDDSSFLIHAIEASGGSHLDVEEASGRLLSEEGFVIAGNASEEGDRIGSEETSGNDMLETEEPDFVYTTFAMLTADEGVEQAITRLQTTAMTTKMSADDKLTTTETVLHYCPESQFECVSNHHCIPKSTVCDLIPDCDDQSDEDPQICSPERICSDGYFRCGTSPQCVEESSRCNGIYNCYNGADEADCLTCEDRHGHIKKLTPGDFCDGFQDCKNNMDEDEKRCRKPCPASYQRCDDGLQCINEEFVCNGIYNCRDKSDEKQCSRSMLDCWTYNMFACDGICQSHTALCDYINDCSNGMDEKGCRYETPKTCPKEFIYQPETDKCLHKSLIYSQPYDLLQILEQTHETNQEEEMQQLEEKELIM